MGGFVAGFDFLAATRGIETARGDIVGKAPQMHRRIGPVGHRPARRLIQQGGAHAAAPCGAERMEIVDQRTPARIGAAHDAGKADRVAIPLRDDDALTGLGCPVWASTRPAFPPLYRSPASRPS